jgi:hypothetical protein
MARSLEDLDIQVHIATALGEERYKDIIYRIDRLEGLMLKGGGVLVLGMASILTKLLIGA